MKVGLKEVKRQMLKLTPYQVMVMQVMGNVGWKSPILIISITLSRLRKKWICKHAFPLPQNTTYNLVNWRLAKMIHLNHFSQESAAL